MRITSVKVGQQYRLAVTPRKDKEGVTHATIQTATFSSRMWKHTLALVNPADDVVVEVVEVDRSRKIIMCNIISGDDVQVRDYTIDPYVRKDGSYNSNLGDEVKSLRENRGHHYFGDKAEIVVTAQMLEEL